MTEAAVRAMSAAAPIGPGQLVLVVGPSGAGKDTILNGAKAICAKDKVIVFPRRAITRPPNGFENHDSIDVAQFAAAARDGAFALSWKAHGLFYGIPAAIDADIRDNRTIVCNVSRGTVDAARGRYARVLSVLITASPGRLAARLCTRGRITDGSVAARLDRNKLYAEFSADAVITNDGTVEDAVRLFVELLRRVSAR